MKLLFLCSLYTILAAPVYDDYNRNFDLEDTIGNSKYADFGDSDFVDPDLIESDLVESDYQVDSSVEIGSIVFVDLASCNAQSILSVSSFLVTPDPSKVGQNLTIIASGILSSPIVNGATLHITVKLGFISLLDQTQNLCDLTGENGIKCPISVGQHDIKAGFPIPAIAPKQTYKLLLSAKNPDGSDILCLAVSLRRGVVMSKILVGHRLKIWKDQLRGREIDKIRIKFGDESIMVARNLTRPMDLKKVTKGLTAKIDNQLWDMGKPFDRDCNLEIVPEEHAMQSEYAALLGNSGAVLLGSALEKTHPDLVLGSESKDVNPFYLDLGLYQPKDLKHLNRKQLINLSNFAQQLGKECLPFERMDVEVDVAKEIFRYSPLKSSILSKMDGLIPLVKLGNFIDISNGPLVAHSGQVSAVRCLESSAAIFKADSGDINVNRLHSVAFPTQESLQKWLNNKESMVKLDHRHIGKEQKLFYMHPLSPGSIFMLPHGVRIVNRLLEYLRSQYRTFGYHEVISPLLFNKALWECSGHWENYKEDMFMINQIEQSLGTEVSENLEMGLKPMNCPGHCLIYGSESRSYRDLPLRYADFSPLHRNEETGALTGLTRVRKFHQDDGHIFCRADQIEQEISATLEFVQKVYSILGFPSLKFCLSTRPQKYMGKLQDWTNAETALVSALKKNNIDYSINEGDGAFYGPKIDILVKDSFGKSHQTATVQLDFQLPERFNLEFTNKQDSLERPIIIHRAVLGSLERMMAILIEHYQGKWPFWLSPRQGLVMSVGEEFNNYAVEVANFLSTNGSFSGEIITGLPDRSTSEYYFIDTDISERTLKKKVHEAQSRAYNFMIIVGKEEYTSKTVSIRARGMGNSEVKKLSLIDALSYFKEQFNKKA